MFVGEGGRAARVLPPLPCALVWGGRGEEGIATIKYSRFQIRLCMKKIKSSLEITIPLLRFREFTLFISPFLLKILGGHNSYLSPPSARPTHLPSPRFRSTVINGKSFGKRREEEEEAVVIIVAQEEQKILYAKTVADTGWRDDNKPIPWFDLGSN